MLRPMPGVLADYKEERDVDPPETCSAALSETVQYHTYLLSAECVWLLNNKGMQDGGHSDLLNSHYPCTRQF